MITKQEFDRVQRLLGRNGNPRPQSHADFAFTGLISCGECGCQVTAEEKHQLICDNCRFKFAYRRCKTCPRCRAPIQSMTKPVFLHYTYYHCTRRKPNQPCSQKAITATELESQIDQVLARIHISEEFKTYAISYLDELTESEMASRKDILESQQRAYQECLCQIDNLIALKTSALNSDGSRLSNEEYNRQRVRLLNEKNALEELLRDVGDRVEKAFQQSEEAFNFAHTARDRFAKGDSQTKKEMLVSLGSNLILKDKKLNIQAKQPFLILENLENAPELPTGTIEPETSGVSQGLLRHDLTNCPRLLGDLDDVRTYGYKASRAAALIYAHFKKEFGIPHKR